MTNLTTAYLGDAKAAIWEIARKLRNQIGADGFHHAAPYMAIAIGSLDQAVSELEKAICADTHSARPAPGADTKPQEDAHQKG